MVTRLATVLLTSMLSWAASAAADPIMILPAGATWDYTFTDPTADPTWNTTTGVGGTWSSGAAPFGNCPAAGCLDVTRDFDFNTFWPADAFDFDDDLWVRTEVSVDASLLESLHWVLGVDNGFKLYVNGMVIAADNAEGYTSRWEYSGRIPATGLDAGSQVIALALEDHGVLTAFDMQISTAPIPEPSTLFLLGAGVAGGAIRRWRTSRRRTLRSAIIST
jgi:hypothetical protein